MRCSHVIHFIVFGTGTLHCVSITLREVSSLNDGQRKTILYSLSVHLFSMCLDVSFNKWTDWTFYLTMLHLSIKNLWQETIHLLKILCKTCWNMKIVLTFLLCLNLNNIVILCHNICCIFNYYLFIIYPLIPYQMYMTLFFY